MYVNCYYVYLRDGRMQAGDEILMVNGQSIRGRTAQQLATMLDQHRDSVVQLVISRSVSSINMRRRISDRAFFKINIGYMYVTVHKLYDIFF